MSNRSARPKWVGQKQVCDKCGRKDLPTKSHKCRGCDPRGFYSQYPAGKPEK